VTIKKNLYRARELLDIYEIPYIEISRKTDVLLGKAIMQFWYAFQVIQIVIKNKINIGIGSSLILGHVSLVTKMRSIILDDDDDDVQPFMVRFGHPFADILLSPDVLKGRRRKKTTLYYPAYHELAYLHPDVFRPDPGILKLIGLSHVDPYFVMRFNTFRAHHDVGALGLSLEQKLEIIRILEPIGRILITTEEEIEPELRPYQLQISPDQVHSLLAYATMFIGDSQTMTSEASVLGVPALRCNSFVGRISYLEEQEQKYALTFGFKPEQFDMMIVKLRELLSLKNLKGEWQKRREKMLRDKINLTAFLVWFVENFPASVVAVKENENIWKGFY
jgi:predicted glycosyltransferase